MAATLSAAMTEIFGSIGSAAALFTEGALIYVPALALAGWGVKKVFGVFRRR